ncbi:MAG: ABC transporter permease, partial [Gammaproteobacteria bacterium]
MSRRILRMALRRLPHDLGQGGMRLQALAVLVAVAAVTAVGFFTDRVGRALTLNAAQMLGADLALVSSRPIPRELAARARARGLAVAETVEFPSVAAAGEAFALVEVKAVSPGYPLRGELRTAGELGREGRPADGIPAPDELWGGPGLASRLGVQVGDRVRLGRREFVLARILTWEPDRGGSIVAVAPRALINLADLASTGLVGEASRVRYRLLAAGPADAVQAWQKQLARALPDGIALQDLANARPEIRTALERAGRFLGLAALCAVLVAAMAVLLAAQDFVDRNSDAGAVLRCLGLTRAGLLGW